MKQEIENLIKEQDTICNMIFIYKAIRRVPQMNEEEFNKSIQDFRDRLEGVQDRLERVKC